MKFNPPDFTVMIDGESFPAEVTSIVSCQQYNHQCKEFCEAIRDRANSHDLRSVQWAVGHMAGSDIGWLDWKEK